MTAIDAAGRSGRAGCAAAALAAMLGAGPAAATDWPSDAPAFALAPFDEVCGGACGAHVFAGVFLNEPFADITFASGEFSPAWEWDMIEDEFILGGALNRRLATFFGVFDVEAEIGTSLRFEDTTAAELWLALYGRWTWFPWNHHVRTTIAVSTGLNWASTVTDRERNRSVTGGSSNLLHYLSPEITFADPDWQATEVVVRIHHRSGGGQYITGLSIFDEVAGGAQYLTLGLRHRF